MAGGQSSAGSPFPFTASGVPSVNGQSIKHKVTGFFVAENAGTPAAARVLFRDGNASGTIFLDVRLAAGESIGDLASGDGGVLVSGVYVEVVSGTVRGAVYGR